MMSSPEYASHSSGYSVSLHAPDALTRHGTWKGSIDLVVVATMRNWSHLAPPASWCGSEGKLTSILL